MGLARASLLALSRKYEALAELRRAQHQMSQRDVQEPLRQLSREFPGALRELDSLPLEEILGRALSLSRCADGAEQEPWMEWAHVYHLTMRAALSVKRRTRARRALSAEEAGALAQLSSQENGCACDAAFVNEVVNPPNGRVNAVVFARLEQRFGLSAAVIREALFLKGASARR